MVATEFEKKFARASESYFDEVLEKGKGDKVKTLLKAIKAVKGSDFSASGIAKEIKGANAVTQKDVDGAKAAAATFKTAAEGALKTAGTDLGKAVNDAADLVAKVGDAITNAGKIKVVADVTKNPEGDLQATKDAVTKPLSALKSAADIVNTKLGEIVVIAKDISTKTGTELTDAVTSIKAKLDEAKTAAISAQTKLNEAKTKAGALVGTDNDSYKTVADAYKTVADAAEGVAVTVVKGVGAAAVTTGTAAAATGLFKDVDDANNAYTKYATAQKIADDMVVGDDPVLTAAKDLLTADIVTKIQATAKDAAGDTAAEKLYVDKAPEFLKDYGFINAILKNVPNKGAGVLTATTTFNAYKSDDLKDDALKAGIAYAKIVSTVCGTGPFVEKADLPENNDDTHHATTSNRVETCLNQANKIAFTLLNNANCGKDTLDSGNVKADCYKALADNANDLYNVADFDKMDIDLGGKYPYDAAYPELDAIA